MEFQKCVKGVIRLKHKFQENILQAQQNPIYGTVISENKNDTIYALPLL
jgi:hypothetical protein